jgi:hypothetical protein
VIRTIGSFNLKRVRALISAFVSGCSGSKSTIAQSGRHCVRNNWTLMLDAQIVQKPSRSLKSSAVDVRNSFEPTIRMFLLCPIGLSRFHDHRAHKPPAFQRRRYRVPTESSAPTCFAFWHWLCLQDSSVGLVPRAPSRIRGVLRLERDPS